MIHLSHDLFEPVVLRQNSLSRQEPYIKVIACVICLLMNLLIPHDLFQTVLILACLFICLSWRVKVRYVIARLSLPLFIGAFLLLLGMARLHLVLVMLAGVFCLSLLSFSTPVEDLLFSLRRLGCPHVIVEVMFLMYKYIFIFFEEADSIYHAQAARLGYADFKTSLSSFGVLAGMLLVSSFERASACYEAILSRGYSERLLYSSSSLGAKSAKPQEGN